MERLILKRLLEWKNSPYRKPLILKGVRQVGKTWILKEFGRRYYDNTAYFNFDEHEEYKQFFETTKDVDRLLQNLMLASGQKITPEKTLIIFDEVQDCPKVINSMKYFCENAPQYHIACAGSLLGIALAKPSSFPVGKVNFMQIDPMTFTEFLLANGDENLANYLDAVDTLEPLPDAFFNPLYEKLKMYYVTGGMPESVLMWTQARDVEAMQEALSGIIGAYERDFAKHPNVSEFPKISMIWKSVPSQLARENKKFIYKVVKEGARAREYEDALQWDDLNFKTGVLNVNKQVYDVRGQLQISTPKTKNSVRKIVLPPAVVAVLREYKKTVNSRWMFPSPVKEDCPITPGVVRRRLQLILEHAGCKHVRFHDLRHPYVKHTTKNKSLQKQKSQTINRVR